LVPTKEKEVEGERKLMIWRTKMRARVPSKVPTQGFNLLQIKVQIGWLRIWTLDPSISGFRVLEFKP
jgi:hypothetical protein